MHLRLLIAKVIVEPENKTERAEGKMLDKEQDKIKSF